METKIDCLLVTFKSEEYEAVIRQLAACSVKPPTNDEGSRWVYSIRTQSGDIVNVAVVRSPRQGNISAVAFLHKQLTATSPRIVITVGIAGAVATDDIFLGDVLVATQIHDLTVGADTMTGREVSVRSGYVSNAVSEFVVSLGSDQLKEWRHYMSSKLRPIVVCPESLNMLEDWNSRLTQAIEKGKQQNASRWIDGSLASSDTLVKTPETAKRWFEIDRKILGCDMESAGVARACEDSSVPLLVIRGISDIIGLARSNEWEHYACEAAASFAIELLGLDCIRAIENLSMVKSKHFDQSETIVAKLSQLLADIRTSSVSKSAPMCREAFELFKQLPKSVRSLQAPLLFNTLDKPMKFLGNKQFVLDVANACLECCSGDNLDDALVELEARARICGTSWAYQRIVRLDLASDEAFKAIEISKGIGSAENLAYCHKCLGRIERLRAERESTSSQKHRHFLQSVKSLTKAIELFGTLAYHGQDGEEVGDCYSLLGRTFLKMDQLEDAKECAERARLRINNTNKDYLDLCILDGDINATNGKYEAAVLDYQRVTATSDRENYQYSEIVARAHLQMGRALLQLNEENQAIGEFEAAKRIWRHYEEWEFAADAEWEQINVQEQLGRRAIRLLSRETPLVRCMAFKVCQEQLADKDPRAIAQRRAFHGLDDTVWRNCISKAKQRIAKRQDI